jgi:hypothetical protein
MKVARKWSTIAAAICVWLAAICGYLRYEQRNELARYQLGYAQGLEIGELRQREEFKKNFNCYRISDSRDVGVTICGVLVPTDQDGNPVQPSLADPSDLEQ